MKRLVVIILVVIIIVTIAIMSVPMSLYNYYTYTIPMRDPLIDYTVADFHYPPVNDASFLIMKSATLLDDGSIDVEFRPNNRYVHYNGSNFAHVENIKAGQTFVVSCMYEDYGNQTLHIIPNYEELKKSIEETRTISYVADEEYFENNCNNDPDEEGCNRLYNAFLSNSTINVQESYGYTRPYLDKEFYDKPFVQILRYMGLGEINDNKVYVFHHIEGYLRDYVPCNYPQVIEHSVNLVYAEPPDWYLCTYSGLYRPSMVLYDFEESRCAPYKES